MCSVHTFLTFNLTFAWHPLFFSPQSLCISTCHCSIFCISLLRPDGACNHFVSTSSFYCLHGHLKFLHPLPKTAAYQRLVCNLQSNILLILLASKHFQQGLPFFHSDQLAETFSHSSLHIFACSATTQYRRSTATIHSPYINGTLPSLYFIYLSLLF